MIRTQETMRKEFITCPSDVFTIKSHSNCLSDSIAILITNKNTKEEFYVTFKNFLPAWKMLKQLNEMGGRKVLYQVDDTTPIPFETSIPYTHRFGSK